MKRPSLQPSLRSLLLSLFLLCSLALVVVACPSGTDFSLDGVVPNQGFTSADLTITIQGRELNKDLRAFLQNSSGESFELKELQFIDKTKLQGKVPKGLPVGAYDLLVGIGGAEPVRLGAAYEVLPEALVVYFLQAGQGDATLILSSSGTSVLIDASREDKGSLIRQSLDKLGIKSLDYIVATHYDADHVGGFEKILFGPDGKLGGPDDLVVRKGVIDRGFGGSKNYGFNKVRDAYKKLHKPLDGKNALSFPSIPLGGGAVMQVLTTNGVIRKPDGSLINVSCGSDENCRSVGTLLTLGKFRLWTGGDLTGGGNSGRDKTPDVETKLAPILGKVDVYRAHHHGSNTSSNTAFLKTLDPQLVVVSAGTDNHYCHPNKNFLQRLLQFPDLQVMVTSRGVLDSKSCKSTSAELSPFGNRAILDAGTIRLIAKPAEFTVQLPGRSPKTWKTR